jgi:type I restriction enzyme R subunit
VASSGLQPVIGQAKRYSRTLADSPFRFGEARIPFVYSTNGYLVYHADLRPSLVTQREVARFHTPAALREGLSPDFPAADTWLREHPINDPDREYPRAAIAAIETGIRNGKRRMMVSMATGNGKTRMAIASIYRLMKSRLADRVLFLLDRRALAAQAVGALAAYEPEPGPPPHLEALPSVRCGRLRQLAGANHGLHFLAGQRFDRLRLEPRGLDAIRRVLDLELDRRPREER